MEFDGYTIVRREIAHGGSGVVHDALSPNKHFSFKWHRLRTCIIIFLMTSIPLLFFIDDSAAMEIRNGQLVIPTAEITLIWEHYCMKHMRHNEWHLARLNKKTIEYQRENKQYWAASSDQLAHFQEKLEEAQAAEADAGDIWGCYPPPAKIAFTKLKVGQCNEARIPESFISSDNKSVDTEASIALLDSSCTRSKIDWIISLPKYDVRIEIPAELITTSSEIGNPWLSSASLSSDETVYACRIEQSDERKKMGRFTAAKANILCGPLVYELERTPLNQIISIDRTLDIPQAPSGDRGNDFKIDIEARLSCDGVLSDNISVGSHGLAKRLPGRLVREVFYVAKVGSSVDSRLFPYGIWL